MTIDEARGGGREIDRIGALAVQLTAALEHELPAAPDGSQVRLVPDGWRMERLAPLAPALPDHVRQLVSVDELDSFLTYYEAFAIGETRIFADARHGTLTAVFDYHAAAEDPDDGAAPGRCTHRMVYSAPKSVEWTRWCEMHRRPVEQEVLLEFLEENAQDVVAPAAAEVLEMVGDFRSIRSTKVTRRTNLTDGSVALSFSDEETGEQSARVPTGLTIAVPIFEGGPRVEVKVYLRTRTAGGKLGFLLVIHRKELLERELFREAVKTVEETLNQPIWWGRFS